MFFRSGAESALEYIRRRKIFSDKQIERLKNVILKNYQIWYLIDYAREKFNPNIDENWALAVVSLTLIENVVKYYLVQLGVTPIKSFEENAKTLVELVKKEGIKLDLQELIEAWGGRKISVHEAYKYQISEKSAQRSYERALGLIGTLSRLKVSQKQERIFVIDWSEPTAPLTGNRVIVVDNEAYYMGEPYDSWVKQKT